MWCVLGASIATVAFTTRVWADGPKSGARVPRSNWEKSSDLSGEFGAITSLPAAGPSNSSVNPSRAYLLLSRDSTLDPSRPNIDRDRFLFSGAVRGVWDADSGVEGDIRKLLMGYSNDVFSWDFGVQEIAWGETFGTEILDIVNPRDYRDPLAQDFKWKRIPIAAISAKIFLSRNTTTQLIYTPAAKASRLPAAGSFFDPLSGDPNGIFVEPPSDSPWRADGAFSEFGGRISHLFPGGFDVAFLYYNHFNRNLIFVPTVTGTLKLFSDRMQTYGFSFSKGFDAIVLRNDFSMSDGEPIQYQLTESPQKESLLRNVTELDISIGNRFNLGLQWQQDVYRRETLNWMSVRIERDWWKGKLNSTILIFRGLGNQDFWVQPQLAVSVSDAARLLLQADLVRGGQDSQHTFLNYWESKSRYRFQFEYRF